ncbi:MAG: hypothetical protein GWO84_00790 [Euryarchaeota archaeon]|nr:hypothetical protein [Euryarchaeota archaeon]
MQADDSGNPVKITPWGEPPPQAIPQPVQPQPQVINQPPQPVMMGTVNPNINQGFSPFPLPVQCSRTYKKIYANDWLIMGIASTIIGFMGPGICWLISLVGVISMATKLNIGGTEPGHPEAEKVKSALIANLVAIILPLIVMVVMFSADF